MSELRTPLKAARGLGTAREGTGHFIVQRATAIMLIPLVIWFAGFVVMNIHKPHAEVVAALRQPHVSIFLLLFLLAGFQHMRLGLQVVVEDYIARHATRILFLLLINALTFAIGFTAVFSVLRISFGS